MNEKYFLRITSVNRIQVLRDMGFSLGEIAGLMEKQLDANHLEILLQSRKREIVEAIGKENEKLRRVETMIKLINEESLNMKYEITVKSIPSYKVLALRDIIPTYSEEMKSAYHALGVWMDANGYEMNGPTRAIYHKGPWCEQEVENYLTEIQAPVVKKQ